MVDYLLVSPLDLHFLCFKCLINFMTVMMKFSGMSTASLMIWLHMLSRVMVDMFGPAKIMMVTCRVLPLSFSFSFSFPSCVKQASLISYHELLVDVTVIFYSHLLF